MPLIEHTLFGDVDKVQVAIERLKTFEPPEGYYLAFSGGKDSITIYRLAEMAGVRFDAHFSVTTVDPPEVMRFIKQEYPQVQRHRPKMSMFRLIVHEHYWPPMRQRRWCCQELKEIGGGGRIVLTGVRREESIARRRDALVWQCEKLHKTVVRPIIDWTKEDVWEFIHQENLPYCSLYDEGFERIGCILCPMNQNSQRDIKRWPQFAKAYIYTFDRMIEERIKLGKKTSFANGKEIFDWWIQRRSRPTPDSQLTLFD